MPLDRDCRCAIRFAGSAITGDARLDVRTLAATLVHETDLRERLPGLAARLCRPRYVRLQAGEVPAEPELAAVLDDLARLPGSVSPRDLMLALLSREAPRRALERAGVGGPLLGVWLEALGAPPAAEPATFTAADPRPADTDRSPTATCRRPSAERRAALEALARWGTLLADGQPPQGATTVHERALKRLVKNLVKPRRRSCIIHGPSGCGKTALVRELARRIAAGGPGIPRQLRDVDIFALDPTALRAGVDSVGTYEERLQDLQGVLAAQPDIVLFVDEVHVLFRSAMHHHDPFSAADESFKRVLSSGRMCALGCTTSVEYRHYIAPDPALARRFEVVALPTPTPAQTRVIARAKLPGWAAQHGLRIPEELADMAVDLSEERIPSRLQPDKALRLLEDACAVAMTAEPPAATLTAAHLEEALRDSQGYCEAWAGDLDEHQIFARLTARLHGQDDVLRRVSSAFLAGLGTWRHSGGPRGVFLFAGPTGVGKTECAKALAGILGGQRADPIRVDCNTLQAAPHDPGPALNRLLGVPRGYVGYVPGEGGVLSRVRDQPAGVVLFDEIEKAPPCVGQVLLQILDEGRVEDSEGNLLDFRHAFLVLTTNAGCSYRARVNLPAAGFGIASRRDLGRVEAHATEASVRAALLELGLGQEFLARIERVFVFHAIEGPAAGTILRAQLAALAARVGERGYRLEWSEDLASHLLAEWQTSFGVRHLTTILANRVEEQLSLADARGELSGVKTIRLDMLAPQPGLSPELASGLACSRRDERDPAALRILLG